MSEMYTTKATLAERVNAKLIEKNMTKAELAIFLKVNRTTVSHYLNSKPVSISNIRLEQMEKDMEGWLKEVGEAACYQNVNIVQKAAINEEPMLSVPVSSPDKGISKVDIYESKDYKGIIGLCTLCQENQELGIIVGRSGFGKTYSLKTYARLPKVVHIECNETMNCKDIVRKIERSIGLIKGYGSIDERLERIYDFFNTNKGYLLIVDEADKLLSKYTIKKIELIRNISDCATVGIVLAGEPALESALKAYDNRFASRMDLIYKLQGLTKKEVTDYFAGYEIEEDALEEFCIRACNKQTGCFRLMDRTLNNVIRILKNYDKKVITHNVIAEASSMMIL